MSVGTQPGPYTTPQTAPAGGPPIKNWLVEAIITTVCCGCLPMGIVAIVFASQVNTKLAAGDRAGAEEAAKKAKMFTIISFVIWLVFVGLYIVLLLAGAVSGVALDQ